MSITSQDIRDATFGQDPAEICELTLTNKGAVELGTELATLQGLTDLNLSFNQLKSVKALGENASLEKINLNHNQLKTLRGLGSLTELRVVKCTHNALRDISALAACTKLEELWLQNNDIAELSQLSCLASIPSLKRLVLRPCPVARKLPAGRYRSAVLAEVPQLQWLDADAVVGEERAGAQGGDGSGMDQLQPGAPSGEGGGGIGDGGGGGDLSPRPLSRNRPRSREAGVGARSSAIMGSVAGIDGLKDGLSFGGRRRSGRRGRGISSALPPLQPSAEPPPRRGSARQGRRRGALAEGGEGEGASARGRSAPVHGRRARKPGAAVDESLGAMDSVMGSLPKISIEDGLGGSLRRRRDEARESRASAVRLSRTVGPGLGGVLDAPKVPPTWYALRYGDNAGGGLGVVVRDDGSAYAKWPNDSLAVSVDREGAAGSAFRLSACFRVNGNLAAAFDATSGSANYPNGRMAFNYNRDSGDGFVYSAGGDLQMRWNDRESPLEGSVDCLLDQHLALRFTMPEREALLYFSCGPVRHRFVCGENPNHEVWEGPEPGAEEPPFLRHLHNGEDPNRLRPPKPRAPLRPLDERLGDLKNAHSLLAQLDADLGRWAKEQDARLEF